MEGHCLGRLTFTMGERMANKKCPLTAEPEKKRLSILSPDFKYRPSYETNVAQTFARIRKKLQQEVDKKDTSNIVHLRKEP